MNRWIAVVVSACAFTASAAAEERPALTLEKKLLPYALPPVAAGELGGQTIFMNRCVGGCTVMPGPDDASIDRSIVTNRQAQLAEYAGFTGTEWADIVQCVKEVYSPYNVKVTDVRPTSGVYEQIMVAGKPADLGLPAGVGGVGSFSQGCVPNPKGMAFAFTSSIDVFAQEAGGSRVHGMCWIVAQETAHNFGLDHEFEFVASGKSSCNDPMTYRFECGGQKFFRNELAKVGATAPCGNGDPSNQCFCGDTQNSHQQMIDIFGPGTSSIGAPTGTIALPAPGGALGGVLAAKFGSQRGVTRVDFYLNGWKWASTPGAAFTMKGQPDPSSYQIQTPQMLPDGVYDAQMKAYDDLGQEGATETVTVTKGEPCESADTCLDGQKCEAGKCFWEQPTGELGDECSFDEACVGNLCAGDICTQQCDPANATSCGGAESGLTCETSGTASICASDDSGGCCSVGDRSHTPWAYAGGSLLVLGLIARRRHRPVSTRR